MTSELESALALLRERLSPALAARLGRDRFAENLLDHLRTRGEPALLFSPERLGEINEIARQCDPEEYAWERRIADEAVAGRLYAASNPYAECFRPLDRERFDFSSFTSAEPQAIHGLNRMRWLPALAQHYWDRRNRDYFDTLMREWDFFAEKVSPADDRRMAGFHRIGTAFPEPPYSELDTYIRLTNWWWAYWLMLWADEMTPERNAVLLARCLHAFDMAACRGIMLQEHNFTSMEMEGLYLWAATLPEAIGMNVWRHNARANLGASLARAVLPDGGQWEMSISYQAGCVRWYGTPCLLARRQGELWPDAYVDRIITMARMIDAVVMPDGTTPCIGDSDRTGGWHEALAIARALRPDVRFASPVTPSYVSLWRTDGQTWDSGATAPAAPTCVFPDTGLAVARSGVGPRAAVVILDNGPRRPGHAHEDNLTIHFEAFGRPVIVDPGRWIYDTSPDRSWIHHAVSHNVPWISDEPLTPAHFVHTSPHDQWFHFVADMSGLFADPPSATSDTVANRLATRFCGFTQDRHAAVKRCVWLARDADRPWLVVADRIEGISEHEWTNSWLVPAEAELAESDGAWTGRLTSNMDLSIVLPTGTSLGVVQEERFWCPNYGIKDPAVWLRFGGRLTSGLRAFAFIPSEGAARPARLDCSANRITLAVDGKEHVLAMP